MFSVAIIIIELVRKLSFFVVGILYPLICVHSGLTYLSDKAIKIYYHYIMKKEIETREDISLLVENFYRKVMDDDLLEVIFKETLFFNRDTHIPVMIDFWETLLLKKASYKGNTMRAHIDLNKKFPLKPDHFKQWKKLFFETLDEHFTGRKVLEAKKRVELMEVLIQTKIAQSNNSNFIQ